MGEWEAWQIGGAWDSLCAECDSGLRAALKARLFRLRQLGNRARYPLSSHLEDGIYELRAQNSGNIARALFIFMPGFRIVFLNGFIKKTQKTPRREIEIAKSRRAFVEGERENEQIRPVEN